jgi:hypothetical protein
MSPLRRTARSAPARGRRLAALVALSTSAGAQVGSAPASRGAALERVEALAARASRRDASVLPEVVHLLDHADWRVRWHAVRCIGMLRAEHLDARVAAALDDPKVAPMAAYALGQLVGRTRQWPPLDHADALVATARRYWKHQSAAGEGWVTHRVCVSPDGATVALGSMHAERGTAYLVLRDVASGRERARVRYAGPIRSISFAADAAVFATTRDDGHVCLHDPASGNLRHEFPTHEDWIRSVALAPDGAHVASSGRDRHLVLREVSSGTEVWRRELPDVVAEMAFVRPGDRSPGLMTWRSGRLSLWSLGGDETVLAEDWPPVVRLAPSRDGRHVAILHADGTLRLWDPARRRATWVVQAHAGRGFAVAFAQDGEIVATSGADRRIRTWSVAGGARRSEHTAPRNVHALCWVAGRLTGAAAHGMVPLLPADERGGGATPEDGRRTPDSRPR